MKTDHPVVGFGVGLDNQGGGVQGKFIGPTNKRQKDSYWSKGYRPTIVETKVISLPQGLAVENTRGKGGSADITGRDASGLMWWGGEVRYISRGYGMESEGGIGFAGNNLQTSFGKSRKEGSKRREERGNENRTGGNSGKCGGPH